MAVDSLLSKDEVKGRAWHAVPPEEALESLRVDPDVGLDEAAIEERRRIFGSNELTPASQRSMLQRLLAQFNNLFIYLLLVAGAITAALGEFIDAGVIFGVVFIIAIIGFVQEGRAEKALESVRGMLSTKAWAVRGKRRREIPADRLVVGDIVVLDAGERVPADVRLVRIKNLQAQEAALTGESTAVEKRRDPVEENAELGDRLSMAYSGTVVTAGQGIGVVVAVGDDTQIGRISGMLSDVEKTKTPLMERLDGFTKLLSVVIIGLALVTFGVGVLVWGRDWGEMFLAAVSLAVAAIPEGLPAVMTVTLAIGVERMARRNAIIRRLPAVETLGAVTTICADKTGTLTRNEMTAKSVRTALTDIETEGVGYAPHGGFLLDGAEVDVERHASVFEAIRIGLLCNDASVEQEGEDWKPEGDPTEAALVVLARKAGLDPEREKEERPRRDVIPFSSERRFMATLVHDHEGRRFVYVKGAPERVLDMCAHEDHDGEAVALDREAWERWSEEIAARGQRLLAAARKEVHDLDELDETDVEDGFVLVGLYGLIDPPRDEAIASVATCHAAGIGVKMITGDHALTARAVAQALGLAKTERAVTGREIEALDDEALREIVRETDVFARASPEHKLRLVRALQEEREVVAMTGDGVNDAPALKRADVGIAMGKKGTEAAREASEMVLADDNFASIEKAVEEGRTVYDNLRKAILFILPTNAAQALIVVTAILAGLTLPVTPVQILWVNMITAVTLGIAFAWEKAEGDLMRRPPHPVEEPLLTGFVVWRIAFVGLLLLAGAGGLFLWAEANGGVSEAYARTMAVNVLVMGQIFYLVNTRYFYASAVSVEGFTGNKVVLIAIGVCLLLQLGFIYLPFMNVLFETQPLDVTAWGLTIGVGVAVFAIVELEKLAARRGLHPFVTAADRGEGPPRAPRRIAADAGPRVDRRDEIPQKDTERVGARDDRGGER